LKNATTASSVGSWPVGMKLVVSPALQPAARPRSEKRAPRSTRPVCDRVRWALFSRAPSKGRTLRRAPLGPCPFSIRFLRVRDRFPRSERPCGVDSARGQQNVAGADYGCTATAT
jgi:hypothetical protein